MQSLRLKPLSYEQLLSGVSGITEAQARIASILDSSNRLSLAHPIAATYALDLAIENVELYGSVVFNPEAGIRGEKLACTALRVYNKFLDFEPPNTSIVARVARLYPEIAGMDETKRAIATVWASLHAARVLTLVIRKMP